MATAVGRLQVVKRIIEVVAKADVAFFAVVGSAGVCSSSSAIGVIVVEHASLRTTVVIWLSRLLPPNASLH